jgi:G3E family GTPase
MVGGFLGAGKTTAILELARHLTDRGRRVGVIMNDQSSGLVDTAMAAARGFEVAEVAGGCFCCRFNSLVEAADRLTAATAPEVFIAEPVGSCTDLKATVAYPLRRMYGDDYEIAPLSVIVDPLRALRVLGLEPGRSFSTKVRYLYGKQLEEADVIALNKRDLVADDARWQALRDAIAARFPQADVFDVSARSGAGLDRWFAHILTARGERIGPAEIDYQRYGEGEALLGWLNGIVRVVGSEIDGNRLLLAFANDVQRRIAGDGAEVAHLKLTLSEDDGGDLAVVNLVGTDRRAELSHALAGSLEAGGEIIVNLRAEADPARLRLHVLDAVASLDAAAGGPALRLAHVESFRPGQPVPTHRLAEV